MCHVPHAHACMCCLSSRRRYIPTTETQCLLACGILGKLLEKKVPNAAKKLEKLGVDVLKWARQWFDHLFGEVIHIGLALSVLDVFFMEGSKILQRVALAIFKTTEKVWSLYLLAHFGDTRDGNRSIEPLVFGLWTQPPQPPPF